MFCLVFFSGSASATIINVDPGPNAIYNAINTANDGDTLNLSPGTYDESGLFVNKNLSIQAGEGESEVTINGEDLIHPAGRIFEIESGATVTLQNLVLENEFEGGINNAGQLTVIHCIFINNGATDEISDVYGGAIYNYNTITINSCSFYNNKACRSGGALYNTGIMVVNSSKFYDNHAYLDGGAIYNTGTILVTNSGFYGDYILDHSGLGKIIYNTGTITVNSSEFENNDFFTDGICTIYNSGGDSSSRIMNFNRFFGTEDYIYCDSGSMDARYNWWGSNNGPQIYYIYGIVTSSPWLYMTLTASPGLILDGASSTLTASFNNAYDGITVTTINPAFGHLFDGTDVNFNTDLGSVGSQTTTKETSNGVANAILTADGGVGIAHIVSELDKQILNVNLLVTNEIITSNLYVNGVTGNDIWDGLYPTHIVDTITGPMKTIQAAINAVKSGTVNVASGIYHEHLTITDNLSLIGAGQSQTFIDGTNNGIVITITGSPIVNITGVTIRNGKSTTGGGAININTINCILNISNSTLTGNNALWGGAIYNAGTLTLKNSNLTGNTATTLSGGAIYNAGTLTLKNSNLTENIAANNGGGVYNSGTATLHFNRIVSNSPNAIYTTNGVNAQYNWWGNNSDPIGKVYGAVTIIPWLVLNVTANPTIIGNGGVSSITADLLHDSSGGYNDPTIGHVPDGIPVTFSTTLGAINSPLSIFNGVAMATLGSGSVSGIADVSTLLDTETIHSSVTIDTIPPTLTVGDPLKNAVNVTRDKVIKLTFSEPIKVGNMWIELKSSGGTVIPIATSINGKVLTINHVDLLEPGTKYNLILHSGCVTDLAGNPLALVIRTFNTTTDTTKPTITIGDPIKNAINVPRDKIITLTFNEPIKAGTMWIELKTTTGTTIPITTTINGNILTINHSTLLETGKLYNLILHTDSIRDLAGNPLALVIRTFNTTTDTTKPRITVGDPLSNAIDVPPDKLIKLTFSEPIKASNMWIELKSSGGAVIPIATSISGKVLTINHTDLLEPGTKYNLVFHTGCVTDLAGNPLSLVSRAFTTLST